MQLFSALYNMLPSAKASLQKGGFPPKTAAWILIGCFLGGVIGIQAVSRLLHRFIPSHIVDCDHSHEVEDDDKAAEEGRTLQPRASSGATFTTTSHQADGETEPAAPDERVLHRTPSLHMQLSQKVNQLVSKTKRFCDDSGRCHGFSDPCGKDCFQIVQARGGSRTASLGAPRLHAMTRGMSHGVISEQQPLLRNADEETPLHRSAYGTTDSQALLLSRESHGHDDDFQHGHMNGHGHSHTHSPVSAPSLKKLSSIGSISSLSSHDSHRHDDHGHSHSHVHPEDIDHAHHDHHHHVPTNAFLAIGLQTSLAIALHKLPEGFITYATNHANPRLGFSVFMALFIHNITEGFAMALPLYLAIGSRWRAMFWSSILGGVSQPLGAGVAALWFHLSGKTGGAGKDEGGGVYGCMFAITAGIMASVALQLFSESLDLTHNRNLCMAFAFVGMGILGVSSALTAS